MNYFNCKPTIRLICPIKSRWGKISKAILDRKISVVKKNLELSLWFRCLSIKKRSQYIQFDISSYYISISPILLNSALIFACKFFNIDRTSTSLSPSEKLWLISTIVIRPELTLWTTLTSLCPGDWFDELVFIIPNPTNLC